jgi:hypothetical protein
MDSVNGVVGLAVWELSGVLGRWQFALTLELTHSAGNAGDGLGFVLGLRLFCHA